MPDAFRIARLVVERAVASRYGDDIALAAYYGSQARGLAAPTSDIDFFYTPVEGKRPPVNAHFVLDGLPYDFWPVTWSFLTEIAEARGERPWGVAAGILADAQVMYARSPADLARFRALQAQLADLLTPAQRPKMVAMALKEFTQTAFWLWQLRTTTGRGDAAGAYAAGWKLVNSVANSLALANQRYFTKGWSDNWPQVLALPLQPPGLDGRARRILAGDDDALAAADALVADLRDLLFQAQASLAKPQPAAQVFADFYLVVVELRHKIEKACARGDGLAAGHAAFLLQNEIATFMHQVTPGYAPADFHLLGEYLDGYRAAGFPNLLTAAGDLPRLAELARRLDDAVAAWLTENGVNLGVMKGEEAFNQYLNHRYAP